MAAPLEVDTKRLLLRGIPESEAQVFHEIAGDPAVMAHWHPGADPDVAATRERILAIQRHWREHGFGDWGVEEKASGYLIGFSGLHYIDGMHEVNLGYAFRRDAWRRGPHLPRSFLRGKASPVCRDAPREPLRGEAGAGDVHPHGRQVRAPPGRL